MTELKKMELKIAKLERELQNALDSSAEHFLFEHVKMSFQNDIQKYLDFNILYELYKTEAKDNFQKPVTIERFQTLIEKRGIEIIKNSEFTYLKSVKFER